MDFDIWPLSTQDHDILFKHNDVFLEHDLSRWTAIIMTWIWIILAVLYVLSRIDLIPDVLAGWGWIDDIVVLVLLYRYLRRVAARSRMEEQPQAGRRPSENIKEQRLKTPYEILGIPPTATHDEIRSAYRHLAGQYHPDKVAHLGEEFRQMAEIRFKEIQHAYEQLMVKSSQR